MIPRRCLIVLTLASTASILAFAQQAKIWEDTPPFLSALAGLDYRQYLPGAQPSPQAAVRLNDLGSEAYKEDRLVEAARLFRAALEMDADNPYPHYNYAAVLAVFAQGFGHFDAPPAELFSLRQVETDRIVEYREEIFAHLKASVSLREERLQRVTRDSDFDTIRGLTEYEYLLMGPNPSMWDVLRLSPRWYSMQTGAFMPADTLVFLPEYRVRFSFDTRRFELFPEMQNKVDRSFTGCYRVDGDRLIIFADGSAKVIYGKVSVRKDSLGFVVEKRLSLEGFGPFGDQLRHYWEGQDA